jgi:hypothetical protein
MKYTKKDIKGLGICSDYTDERLDELASGRESLSERELAELDIPINDRLWLLGRLCADDKNTVARRIARNVMPLWTVPDVVKRYLETGESDIKAEAVAAAVDAWDAARAAAWAAAWDAWAAAWDAGAAAGAAAWAAARAAARDAGAAAWAAARAAAGDAGAAAGAAARAAAGDATGDAVWAAAILKSKQKYLGWMVEFCESRKAGF